MGLEMPTIEAIRKMVERNDGVAFLPRMCVEDEIRIGLLHDLFHTINEAGLDTAHARICTEKGVAMDTLYITTADRKQIEDPKVLQTLEETFSRLVDRPEA